MSGISTPILQSLATRLGEVGEINAACLLGSAEEANPRQDTRILSL